MDDVPQSELVERIGHISRMIATRQFSLIHDEMESCINDPSSKLIHIICELRGAFPARRMIDGYYDLVDRAAEVILTRWPDRNVNSLLMGLSRDDPHLGIESIDRKRNLKNGS